MIKIFNILFIISSAVTGSVRALINLFKRLNPLKLPSKYRDAANRTKHKAESDSEDIVSIESEDSLNDSSDEEVISNEEITEEDKI